MIGGFALVASPAKPRHRREDLYGQLRRRRLPEEPRPRFQKDGALQPRHILATSPERIESQQVIEVAPLRENYNRRARSRQPLQKCDPIKL